MDFKRLGISQIFADKLREHGISQPTLIQERAIPAIKTGRDVIAQAQTGTGKTLAFILPILEQINIEEDSPKALVITPTRELALQITEELLKLTADVKELKVLAVYGGQDVDKQLRKLKEKTHIVVGTPGRLLDHIARKTIELSQVDFLVLDEADQMLNIGFLDEVEKIISEIPKHRQTLLFSATIPKEIRKLAQIYMREPEYIQVEKKQGPADNVKQMGIYTTDRAKQNTLVELIETHRPFLAVIFCRTKRRATKLYEALKARGFLCDELHGDLSQAKRERVMNDFREAKIQLLVATDVAARGLDVEGVTHVFNYDIPLDGESYVHRIGRTGRAGMKGLAITLYSSKDRPLLDKIESELNIELAKKNMGNTNDKERKGRNEGQKKANNKNNRKPRLEVVQTTSGKENDRKRKGRPKKSASDRAKYREGKPRRKGRH